MYLYETKQLLDKIYLQEQKLTEDIDWSTFDGTKRWIFDHVGDPDKITHVVIPEGVTKIDICAFKNWINLASIDIPNSVTSIGDFAFWNCRSLKSIKIPERVTRIEYGTFEGCTSLTNIYIYQTV